MYSSEIIQEYSQKFSRLKQSLREFADKHPLEENPAYAFLGARTHTTTATSLPRVSGAEDTTSPAAEDVSAVRQAQLEKTVKGLLGRLEAANQNLAQVHRRYIDNTLFVNHL